MGKPVEHSVRFLNLVDDAKMRIKETSVEKIMMRIRMGEKLILVDVRTEREFLLSHVQSSRHLGKGVIERDVEKYYHDLDEEIILYCGGGFRSALAADSLQKMGYTRVYSMEGGFRAWKKAGGTISLA
jgi:rhodanese-related sulfurtransferase